MEDLEEKLKSLQMRYSYLTKFPHPLNNIERLANLGKAINEVKSEIARRSLDWRKYGF